MSKNRFFVFASLLLLALCGCRTHFSTGEGTPPQSTPPPAPITNNHQQHEQAAEHSSLRLPHVFSDNMVLQQGMNVPIWGWAKDGETVTVSFGNQTESTIAHHGKWLVRLNSLKPGEATILTVKSGNETVRCNNVLIGEVWICSGQSNMEWPLNKAFQPEADIASATNKSIRLFVVPNVKANAPTDDVNAQWVVCSPETAATFSAVGYYFGRNLQAARNVPVGLIQSDWGGTPVESWTSEEGLSKIPAGKEVAETFVKETAVYRDAQANYEKEVEEAKQSNKPKPRAPWPPHKPSELYNGMIAPIIPYAIKGVVWYQGENNAGRAAQYRSLFPNMIRDWRHLWNEGDFTFCCVQLAPFKPIQPQPGDSDWAELREAQLLATKTLPKVGMAVITDVGEEHDIHPRKKAPVGERLALAARGIAYGEKVVYSGPSFKSAKFQDGKAILKFDNVGSGLVTHGGALKSFAICGSDRKWVWGLAEIESADTIVVHSPNIENPIAVRFGWADYPVVNLWNREGLPASPFRTDNFPMITEGKK